MVRECTRTGRPKPTPDAGGGAHSLAASLASCVAHMLAIWRIGRDLANTVVPHCSHAMPCSARGSKREQFTQYPTVATDARSAPERMTVHDTSVTPRPPPRQTMQAGFYGRCPHHHVRREDAASATLRNSMSITGGRGHTVTHQCRDLLQASRGPVSDTDSSDAEV